jgi:hypothetical protein
MDREYLDASRLDFTSSLPEHAGECWREATESRLPLQALDGWGGPAVFYVVTEFSTPVARDTSWLLIGSTGPYQAWLDGKAVGSAESYQCMSPHNFALPVSFSAGHHRLVLKLERTSQPLGASVIFKHHAGKHWHQAFYDEAIEWTAAQAR